jgi:CheY-like chemotaxis protein
LANRIPWSLPGPWRGHLAKLSPPTTGGNDPPASSQLVNGRRPHPLYGLRALLVEDQTIIALDTESMLLELGAATVHSFTTGDAAIAWLGTAELDVGVLDVSLGSATSFPVAELLVQRAVPFIFTTGYGDSTMFPPHLLNVPIVRKPYAIESLARALVQCLQRPSVT